MLKFNELLKKTWAAFYHKLKTFWISYNRTSTLLSFFTCCSYNLYRKTEKISFYARPFIAALLSFSSLSPLATGKCFCEALREYKHKLGWEKLVKYRSHPRVFHRERENITFPFSIRLGSKSCKRKIQTTIRFWCFKKVQESITFQSYRIHLTLSMNFKNPCLYGKNKNPFVSSLNFIN